MTATQQQTPTKPLITGLTDAGKAPQRARITWRETPDAGFGKPRTVHEIRTALDPDDLHRQFWKEPAWDVAKTRKVEITEVKWLDGI